MHYLFTLPRTNTKYISNITRISTNNSTIFNNTSTTFSTILIYNIT